MNRDRSPYYTRTSPSKTSQNLSYPRKIDTTDSSLPSRSNPTFLTESKENMPSGLSSGTRDILLMKCKQAIEELHIELEGEKKMKQQIEDALAEAENEAHEKDTQLREMRYKNEKQQEELKTLKIQNEAFRKELDLADDQSRGLKAKEIAHAELQRDFQNVCKANNELKERVEDLKVDLENRDLIIKQWNGTLGSVQDKIVSLEKENSEIKEEYQLAVEENGKLQRLLKEVETSTGYLRDKYEAAERLSQQLQKENKALDNVKEQNIDLREKLQEYERKFATLEEERHLNNLRLEERFLKEKEELEDNLKDRSRRKIGELQENFDLEIFKLKETNENVKNDYFKVKGERDVLKQELARLQDRLDLLELENKKITGTFTSNYESLERKKADEIERLKGVNEDQKRLLTSYEKMLETEKAEHASKSASLSENNTKLREEIMDLKSKNDYLSNKLKDCQEELAFLRNEVNRTFQEEEEKQDHLVRKLNNLETEIVDRNTAINTLNSQVDHLKVAERRQAEEVQALARENKELLEELDITKKQMADLIAENDDLRLKQKEFYEILQGKITQISEELKQEREKRLQAQNKCKAHEEYIVELEAKLKSYKRLAATNPEKSTARHVEPTGQATWDYKRNYPTESTHRQEQTTRPYHQHQLSQELRQKDPVSVSRDSVVYRSQEVEQTPQRLTDVRESHKPQDDTNQYVFINKFKSVIEKLENKLESITADIDNSAA